MVWMDGAAENGERGRTSFLCVPHTHTYFLCASAFFSPQTHSHFLFGFKFSILLATRRCKRRRSERTRKSANLPPDSLRAGGKTSDGGGAAQVSKK